MFKNALVSVSDKTGIVEFLTPLSSKGMRIVSTGGTFEFLKKNGINAFDISQQTGFPEVMGGRVRTLHPFVHMAILARASHEEDLDLLKAHGLEPFDLVVVNLYPFARVIGTQQTLAEKIELIDIGGPTLLRAAAKNFERVTVICEPRDYQSILTGGSLSSKQRQDLAAKVFAHVSRYDSLIAHELTEQPTSMSIQAEVVQKLRYGENPSQQATWFRHEDSVWGLHQSQILQGKELSYNNLLDLDAATAAAQSFDSPCAVIVKHTNPCATAVGTDCFQAVTKALACDPISAFGGIVAANRPMDETVAAALIAHFLECVIAPDFSPSAIEIFAQKPNLRILRWREMLSKAPLNKNLPRIRSVHGGLLVQESDHIEPWSVDFKIFGQTPPQPIQNELMFAWKVCAHLKSNAIVISAGQQTLGLGMGQVNRVDAVVQAIERMQRFHPVSDQESAATLIPSRVLASDAFFPFADSIEHIAKAGISWVIEPGGSVRDHEVIDRAKKLGIHLVLTGKRHFRH